MTTTPDTTGATSRVRPAHLAVVGLMGLIMWRTWTHAFLYDDAYICFRYAENLLAGHGLVWNPGEPVEGYTNFSWVLALAGAMWLGFEPEPASIWMGMGAQLLTLLGVTWLLRRAKASWWIVCGALMVLAANKTFLLFGTSGLATPAQKMMFVGTLVLFERIRTVPRATLEYVGVSAFAALALMTRIDMIVPLTLTIGALAFSSVRAGEGPRGARAWIALLAPCVVALLAWEVWRLSFYGEWLPNTYYAKKGGWSLASIGWSYLGHFADSYLLWLPAVGILSGFRGLRERWRQLDSTAILIAAILALWCVYLIKVGGDFIEFRFASPMIALGVVLGARLTCLAWEHPAPRAGVLAFALLGAAHHEVGFHGVDYRIIALDAGAPAAGVDAGRALRRDLDEANSPPLLVAAEIGAIGYYSGLPTADLHGLTDPWVARHGRHMPDAQVGHQRIASLEYMIDRGAHLWTVNVHNLSPEELARTTFLVDGHLPLFHLSHEKLPTGTRVVLVPTRGDLVTPLLQLAPHPSIDALVRRGDWRTVELLGAPNGPAPSLRVAP